MSTIEVELLKNFISKAIINNKIDRYFALLNTRKGKIKFLKELNHNFESSLKPNLKSNITLSEIKNIPVFTFSGFKGFGIHYNTFSEAYEDFSNYDSWIIIGSDGKYGVYRPESYWDDEILLHF